MCVCVNTHLCSQSVLNGIASEYLHMMALGRMGESERERREGGEGGREERGRSEGGRERGQR